MHEMQASITEQKRPKPRNGGFLEDVLEGFSRRQKSIPPRWFYDLEGSRLFEEITELPEYYLTRVETALLDLHARDVAAAVGEGRVVVEFGSGSSLKTPLLLSKVAPTSYVPIDISGDFLRQSSTALREKFPGLNIIPVEADFMQPAHLPAQLAEQPKLGFFPGSTIGNLSPFAAVDLLRSMGETLGDDAWLLIGMDQVKDVDRLLAAYDDASGITARFNLNILERINRDLGADIPTTEFRHVAKWNEPASRIEMHLEATAPLTFEVAGRLFCMAQGDTIHTESSYKYTVSSARLLLLAGGWSPVRLWSDDRNDFLLILAEAGADAAS
jgi:L-histidine N-alpha-methyltransferase